MQKKKKKNHTDPQIRARYHIDNYNTMCYGEKTGDIKIELEQFLCTLNMTRFRSALLHICQGWQGRMGTGKQGTHAAFQSCFGEIFTQAFFH